MLWIARQEKRLRSVFICFQELLDCELPTLVLQCNLCGIAEILGTIFDLSSCQDFGMWRQGMWVGAPLLQDSVHWKFMEKFPNRI